jgi:hypothetical protein
MGLATFNRLELHNSADSAPLHGPAEHQKLQRLRRHHQQALYFFEAYNPYNIKATASNNVNYLTDFS